MIKKISSKFIGHLSSILTMNWIFWMTNLIRDVESNPLEKKSIQLQPKRKAWAISGTRFYCSLLEFVAFICRCVLFLMQLFIKRRMLIRHCLSQEERHYGKNNVKMNSILLTHSHINSICQCLLVFKMYQEFRILTFALLLKNPEM